MFHRQESYVLEPSRPIFPSSPIKIDTTSVVVDTNQGADPVTVLSGNIDNYILIKSSSDLIPRIESSRNESLRITGLEPGTDYNFSFVSQIHECGGVIGTSELHLVNVCTRKLLCFV